jgi:hypothetical protein
MKAPAPTFAPAAPAGFHRANLQSLIDLGIQPSAKFDPRHELLMIFQLADVEKDGARATIEERVTFSLGKKAKLRAWVESWRGKAFASEQEAREYDLEKLVGQPVYLQVVHKPSGDRVYARILALAPIPGGVEKPALVGKSLIFEKSRPDADAVYASLPEWAQKKIDEALEPESADAEAASVAGTDEEIPF